MKFIKKLISIISILLILTFNLASPLALNNSVKAINLKSTLSKQEISEKRGTPPYDYIIGKDHLPHFRVFFWIPINASYYKPAAAKGVHTNVSHHGPVENWTVAETGIKNVTEKLVYIFVPKTFVFLHGKNFYKSVYLKYE